MNGRLSGQLQRRLFAVYLLIGALSSSGILLSNLLLSQYPVERVEKTIVGLAIGTPLLVLALALYTRTRFKGIGESGPNGADRGLWWSRLVGLPSAVFWIVLLFGFALTQLFQLAELASRIGAIDPEREWWNYLKSALYNLSTYLALAVVCYASALWVLRKPVRQLEATTAAARRFGTVGRPLLLAAFCTILFPALRMLGYMVDSWNGQRPMQMEVVFGVLGLSLAVGFAVLVMIAGAFFQDLRRITERLQSLGGGDRVYLRPLPLLSGYETGRLASEINRLQERFRKEYDRLDRELQLARQVQSLLTPGAVCEWGGLRWTAFCRRSDEVDGGLVDILPLGEHRLAVLAARISGSGLPAALIGAALLSLFRTQAREERDPTRLLARLDEALSDVLTGAYRADLAIGLAERSQGTIAFVFAGEIALTGPEGQDEAELRLPPYPPLGGGRRTDFPFAALSLEREWRLTVESGETAPSAGSAVWIRAKLIGKEEDHG